jgi:ubiquitin-like protein Pup
MSFEQMPRREQEPQETTEVEEYKVDREQTDEVLEATDALLDDIDDILEENAETFIDAFVQKGGQ